MSDNDVLDAEAINALTEAVKAGLIPRISGMEIVLTGKMSMSRRDISALIGLCGGYVGGSVTRRTRLLVTAEGHFDSTKIRAAKRDGVPVLTETTFIEMLAQGTLASA